jgi:hypothetical protein
MSERGDTGPVDWEEEEERLASRSLAAGDPTGWFDRLYAAVASGRVAMPWSRVQPHPLLVECPGAGAYPGWDGGTASELPVRSIVAR